MEELCIHHKTNLLFTPCACAVCKTVIIHLSWWSHYFKAKMCFIAEGKWILWIILCTYQSNVHCLCSLSFVPQLCAAYSCVWRQLDWSTDRHWMWCVVVWEKNEAGRVRRVCGCRARRRVSSRWLCCAHTHISSFIDFKEHHQVAQSRDNRTQSLLGEEMWCVEREAKSKHSSSFTGKAQWQTVNMHRARERRGFILYMVPKCDKITQQQV